MSISVPADIFPNIHEIWEISPNAVEAWTANGRHIRVTAVKNIRAKTRSYYIAKYEEEISVTLDGVPQRVWVNPDFPWQDGGSAEQCLMSALGWVNERGAESD